MKISCASGHTNTPWKTFVSLEACERSLAPNALYRVIRASELREFDEKSSFALKTRRLSMQTTDFMTNNHHEAFPAAIPNLIAAAVASFDADRDTSRRYLLRASAILHANSGGRTGAESVSQPKARGGLLAWQLNRLVDYIEAHLEHKITAQDLADVSKVGIGKLFRAFKISVGVTPFQYITGRRIELACTLMRTTREPLSQVAMACGLWDHAHFCRQFRRVTGMTPSAWRTENLTVVK
jgi:AraC family transcriptional regulator